MTISSAGKNSSNLAESPYSSIMVIIIMPVTCTCTTYHTGVHVAGCRLTSLSYSAIFGCSVADAEFLLSPLTILGLGVFGNLCWEAKKSEEQTVRTCTCTSANKFTAMLLSLPLVPRLDLFMIYMICTPATQSHSHPWNRTQLPQMVPCITNQIIQCTYWCGFMDRIISKRRVDIIYTYIQVRAQVYNM